MGQFRELTPEEHARQREQEAERERERAAEERRQREREAERIRRLRETLAADYLGTTVAAIQDILENLSRDQALAERARFVRDWADRELGPGLDTQQAHAIAAVHEHVLVTARAGSGKTRTLVSRAAFLVRHCRVDPSRILLLAFNRQAAETMRARLERLETPCPHVMTFHALAYAIARPEQSIVSDEPDYDGTQRSDVMQSVVKDFLRDPERDARVREVMSCHFKTDWDRVTAAGVALSREDGLLLRRSLEHETLDGTRVKSFGEKVIANFLFEHDLSYTYEQNHWWNDRNYRPDFTLTARKIAIEYFGITDDPDYVAQAQEKRAYWAGKRDWDLLEYWPRDLRDADGSDLRAALARDLKRLRARVVRLSEEEIWRRVKQRFRTRFAEVLMNIIGRCRKAMLTPESLDKRLRTHEFVKEVEHDVLAIASDAYRAYLNRLDAENSEDFDGLLQRAARLVQDGEITFDRRSGAGDLAQLQFVMVDEYQDFSRLFDLLLSAIRSQNRNIQVFCVGDDWQAINGFAGSDLRFFRQFDERFDPSAKLAVTTNYRSSRAVVEVGNRLMEGCGEPARSRPRPPKGEVILADIAQLRPASVERHHWQGDTITPAVRRIMHGPLNTGQSIAILARQRYLPYQVCMPEGGRYPKEDLSRLGVLVREGITDAEREQVHVGTAHAYKGREADVVILLDAVERRFPKLHPDWVFGRVFGDTPATLFEEERRLFYVACTRAISRLVILTERGRESPFLDEMRGHVKPLDWDSYQPFCRGDGDWIILVGNVSNTNGAPTKARKQTLKQRGYEFSGGEWPHWRNSIPRKYELDWIVENLPRAPWFRGPDGLEIRICTSDGTIVAKLVLTEGVFERRVP